MCAVMSTRVLLLSLCLAACSTTSSRIRHPSIPTIPLGPVELWICLKERDHAQQTRVYAKSAEEAESMLEGYSCTLVPIP